MAKKVKTVKVLMLTDQVKAGEFLENGKVYEVSDATAHLWTGKKYAILYKESK